MDDLIKLKGVGKSTAKVLVEAGFGSVEKLALATAEQRPEALGERVDFESLIKQASELLAASSDGDAASTGASGDDDTDLGPDSDFEVLQVIGPKQGRWRAGLHFTQEATYLRADEITDEAVAAIVDDPALSNAFMSLETAEKLQKKAG